MYKEFLFYWGIMFVSIGIVLAIRIDNVYFAIEGLTLVSTGAALLTLAMGGK